MKKAEEDKRESQVTGVERDILKELREMVQATGASGFHFRVQKKMENGPMSFVGYLDGATEDIPQALLDKWKDGQYRLYAHFNDKRKIPNVPPLDFAVGQPSMMTSIEKEPASKRIKELDEEIEVKKRERELRRAERELRRLEAEEDGGGRDEVFEAIREFEMEIEKLRRENEELKNKTREDRLMSEIAALKKQLEEGGSHKRDPEIEALKVRLAAAEETARKAELDAIKRGFEAQITELKAILTAKQQSTWAPKDYAAAAAPFVPALTAWIEKSAGGKKEALEIVEKVTGVLKAQPKGMELKELISTLTPIVTPLLTRKDESIPAILGLVGNLVGPMVEAAAEAAAHPPSGDDLGASISKVISMIQRSIETTKDVQTKTLEVEKTRLKTAEKLASRMPPRMPSAPLMRPLPAPPGGSRPKGAHAPQRPVPAPAPARLPRSTARPAVTPLVGFVNRIAEAIEEQDEEVEFYVGLAERELPPDDLARLKQYKDATMLSSYLGGLPGVDGSPFQTPYGKKWLNAFLACMHSEEQPALAHTPTPRIAPEAPTAPTPPASSNATKLPPRDEKDVPVNVKLNEFKYPPDSKVDVVEMDGLELPIEYPTPETVAKREQERLQATGKPT